MITLENDRLTFRFPEVHEAARCAIHFQRTLRIPDDEQTYPLPPGLGAFPLRHLDDYARRLPAPWLARGGVIMPMHQAEATWMCFDGGSWMADHDYPFAVKVATGKVCAISGETWVNHLNRDPQDYAVLPEQPWIDGYCVEKGVIRQFVAMPLGAGYTTEEQITGAAEHGGIQIVVYPMKREHYEALRRSHELAPEVDYCLECIDADMGLAPGGRMRQEIYDDPYGLDAWDQRHASRCFVTIANSAQWMAITGERPPTEPPTAKSYTNAGLPWFNYYGGDATALEGAAKLGTLTSVATMGKQKDETPLPENASVEVERIIALRKAGSNRVREMTENLTTDGFGKEVTMTQEIEIKRGWQSRFSSRRLGNYRILGNIFLPNGTQLRFRCADSTIYNITIKEGKFIHKDKTFESPSALATYLGGVNQLNGFKYLEVNLSREKRFISLEVLRDFVRKESKMPRIERIYQIYQPGIHIEGDAYENRSILDTF